MIKLIAFSGSTRKESLNKKLLQQACALFSSMDIEIEQVNLADFDMPIYNGDIEAVSMPENALKLHALFKQADGFVIASPEYNSSFAPLVKNIIDWLSRPINGDNSLVAFSGKTALLISASMGNLGGLRGLYQLRSVLENISMYVSPALFSLPAAHLAFDENNNLKDENYKKMLDASVKAMFDFTKKLKE